MTRFEALAWLTLLTLGAALRIYQIDSIPPGLWFDEAANGVDALDLLAGNWRIFFEGNNGREPFFIYLMASLLKVLGSSPTSIRLTGVVVGIATIGLAFFLGKALLGRHGGLLTMLAVAVSYWHISLSRLGLRAGSLPLFESLAILFLWQGLKSRSVWWFAASGASIGASLYTYLASRAFPLWLGVFLVLVAAFPSLRPGFRLPRFLASAGLLVVAASLTFAPLGLYFWDHPDQFAGRARAVATVAANSEGSESIYEENEPTLVGSVAPTLGMFFLTGDHNARHNLPGRPLLDPLQAGAFLIGVAVLFWNWRERLSVLLLLWLGGGLLPGALSGEAPHFLRTSGIMPGVFVVQVIGLLQAARWIERYFRGWPALVQRHAPSTIAASALLVGGAVAIHDYFQIWAPSAAAHYSFETDLLDAVRLADEAPPGAVVALSSARSYRGIVTPLNFYSSMRSEPRVFNGGNSLLVPATAEPWIYYAIPRSAAPDGDDSKGAGVRFFLGSEPIAVRAGPEQTVSARLYRAAAAQLRALVPRNRLNATFGDSLEVVGYDLSRRISAGETVDLVVYLRASRPFQESGSWQMFAHVTNPDRTHRLGEDYNDSLVHAQLGQGDLLISWFRIPVPKAAPAGVYPVVFGVFERDRHQHLEIIDGQGKTVSSPISLLPVRVLGRQEPIQPEHVADVRFGDSIRLVGYGLKPDLNAKQIFVTLYWSADSPPTFDYTVFTHLVDGKGALIGQQDNQPVLGQLPTTLWDRGDLVVDQYRLPFSSEVGLGARIEIGMYRSDTNARLPLLKGQDGRFSDHVSLPLAGTQ